MSPVSVLPVEYWCPKIGRRTHDSNDLVNCPIRVAPSISFTGKKINMASRRQSWGGCGRSRTSTNSSQSALPIMLRLPVHKGMQLAHDCRRCHMFIFGIGATASPFFVQNQVNIRVSQFVGPVRLRPVEPQVIPPVMLTHAFRRRTAASTRPGSTSSSRRRPTMSRTAFSASCKIFPLLHDNTAVLRNQA